MSAATLSPRPVLTVEGPAIDPNQVIPKDMIRTFNLLVVLYFVVWIGLIGLTMASVYMFATGRRALGMAFATGPVVALALYLVALLWGGDEKTGDKAT